MTGEEIEEQNRALKVGVKDWIGFIILPFLVVWFSVTACGVLLLVFVEPPTRFLAGGDALSGNWRPTILAAVLLAGLAVLLVIPPARAFFELQALTLLDVAVIAGAALLWALLLRFTWRFRLLERLLGIESVDRVSRQ